MKPVSLLSETEALFPAFPSLVSPEWLEAGPMGWAATRSLPQ